MKLFKLPTFFLILCLLYSSHGLAFGLDQALELLRQATEVVAGIKGYKRRPTRDLVIAQANLGDWSGAMQTVELAESSSERDSILYWIGIAKAKAGDFEGTYNIATSHPQILNRDQLLNLAASAAAEQGDIKRAFSIVKEISVESGHWIWAQEHIAIAQVKAGDIEGAMDTADKLARENSYPFRGVFRAYAILGNLDEVVKRSKRISEYWLQGYSQLGIVSGRLEINDIDGAKTTAEIIEWLHARGLAFIAIADKQLEKNFKQKARKSLKEALRAILRIPQGWIRGDALWRIAVLQAKSNDIKKARLTADEIQAGGHRDSALRDIAILQAENGDYSEALQTAVGYEGSAFPDPFHFVIHTQIKNGDLVGAKLSASRVPEKFRAEALALVALSDANPDEIRGILKSFPSLLKEDRFEYVISKAVEVQAKAKQYERVMGIIEEIDVQYMQELSLRAVARVQIESQEWKLAKVTAAKCDNKRIFKELGFAWSQVGKTLEALEWVESLSDPFAKTYALIGIAESIKDLEDKKSIAR
ncbi:MAG: hypothetical protein NPIRA04_35590 [Nitrospirales bacterium]|nr:MAG: hypothetical protein NPIRA04_35590 [Nitrospirales bacterium]